MKPVYRTLMVLVCVLGLSSAWSAGGATAKDTLEMKNNDASASLTTDFELQIHPPTISVVAGEPFELPFTMKNVGKKDRSFVFFRPDAVYDLEIINPRGQILHIKHKEDVPHFLTIVIKLHPGESYTFPYLVMDTEKFSIPGVYSVTASRQILSNNGTDKVRLVSSTISFDAVERPVGTNEISRIVQPGWGPVSEGFQLRLEPPSGDINVKDPFVINILLRNVGRDKRVVAMDSSGYYYELIITDPSGNTRRKPSRSAPGFSGGALIPIQPGASFSEPLFVMPKDHFNSPGTYLVAVSRSVLSSNSQERIALVSNTITLQVTAKADEPAEPLAMPQPSWGPVSEGFQLKLEPTEKEAVAGKPFELLLLLKNVDTVRRDIQLPITNTVYDIHIVDPTGQTMDIPHTVVPKFERRPPSNLPSGKLFASLYDFQDNTFFRVPGVYQVTASRLVPRADGKGTAKLVSNTLALEVKDRPSPPPPPRYGPTVEGYNLEIVPIFKTVKPNFPMSFSLIVKNDSQQTRTFGDRFPVSGVTLRVVGPNGEERRAAPGASIRNNSNRRELGPYKIDTTELRGLPRDLFITPGVYRVTVHAKVILEDGTGERDILSNTVEVTVPEEAPESKNESD